jgi:hypothetical protein
MVRSEAPKLMATLLSDGHFTFSPPVSPFAQVCPWNRGGRPGHAAPAEGVAAPRLRELLALDEGSFAARFAGTPPPPSPPY